MSASTDTAKSTTAGEPSGAYKIMCNAMDHIETLTHADKIIQMEKIVYMTTTRKKKPQARKYFKGMHTYIHTHTHTGRGRGGCTQLVCVDSCTWSSEYTTITILNKD